MSLVSCLFNRDRNLLNLFLDFIPNLWAFRGFHKLDEFDNINIRGFTTWQQKKMQQQNATSSDD